MRHTYTIALAVLAAIFAATKARADTSGEAPEITKLPALTTFVEAVYPEKAEAEGIEAVVILEIDIDEQGTVQAVRVVEPADPPGFGFDEAAMVAVSHFEFTPAQAGGEPVAVTITYKYGFTLAAPEPALEAASEPASPVLSVEGRLLERGTRLPLAGVTVTVFRGEGEDAIGFEATSNAQGKFELYDLGPGEWKILCDPKGYYPIRTAEEVKEGEVLEVTYHVERVSYNPFDVLVEAKRPKKEVNRRTVKTEEIDKVPGTFGDPLAVVTNLPSVARTALGSGLIVVRGSAPEDTRINVEGVDIPYLYHFGGIRSAIPAGMLEYIDFYPGNYSVFYGRATGGMLDVKLKRLDPEKISGTIDVSLLDAGVYLEAPLGQRAAVAVGARRSYIDAILANILPDDSPIGWATAPRYYDFQVLGTLRPAGGHEVRALFFASDDRMEMVFNNPADESLIFKQTELEFYTNFYRGILDYQYTPSETFSNDLRLSVGRDEFFQELGNQWKLAFDILQVQARQTVQWQPLETLSLRTGVEYVYQRTSYDVKVMPPPKEGDLQNNNGPPSMPREVIEKEYEPFHIHLPAAFAELEWKPVERLQIIPGVRLDYFRPLEQLTLDPRLTTRTQLLDPITIKGGVGIFHQAPLDDETTEEFGNPDLKAEWAVHYSVGVEVQPLAHLTIDTTLFYKDLRKQVSRSDAFVERDGHMVPERLNNRGKGRVYGADIMVRHEFANNFFGWIAYTLSRAERLDSGATDYRLFDYDQTHILTVLGTYRLPQNWEVGARWRLVSGDPYTPYVGGAFDVDQDDYQAIPGEYNSGRFPYFHQLDLRVDKRWIYDDWMFSTYLDIQNTYNQNNTEYYEYNYDYSEKDKGSSMTFLTILGLRAEF